LDWKETLGKTLGVAERNYSLSPSGLLDVAAEPDGADWLRSTLHVFTHSSPLATPLESKSAPSVLKPAPACRATGSPRR
jgi:hypothetical protein